MTAPRTGTRRSMFLRMLWRAALLRRGRAASALLAMAIAAAAATAMLNLYVDVQAKLRTEFRKYGANVVIVGKDGASLPADAVQRVSGALGSQDLAVPFSYAIARTAQGKPIVVAGTDFTQIRRLDSWWAVTGWPSAPNDALVGTRAASLSARQGQSLDLSFNGRVIHLRSAGIVQTGAQEESRIYLSQSDFEGWTGVQPSTIEVAVSGPAGQVSETADRLQQLLPSAEVRPIRQITEAEARILGKTRATLLASSVLIVLTAALCVLATLTGWVFDRRRDFAIMKALGASGRLINGFFAAEAAVLGVVGALLGYGVGVAVAAWIGRVNFNAPVVPRLSVLPPVLLGGVLVALLASALPMALLQRVQPAMILRGE
jgi:putative ABC transport system permease protein